VEPIGVRRNKNKTYLECGFIAPEQKAAKQILASIEMSNAPKGQRDILKIMHNMPNTLNDIGISSRTAEAIRAAKLATWNTMLQDWREQGAPRLSWIDLTEPDPKHNGVAMRNERLAPIWKEEQGNEMTCLFGRGCLKKVKRSELPMGARVISSRFHYKIKGHSAGEHKLKVKRLKVRLVVQGQHMSKDKGDFTDAFSPVPHLSGVRCCMSMATAMKWKAVGVDLTQGFSSKPSCRRMERPITSLRLQNMLKRQTWSIKS
jgi:hypothetical protein